MYMPVNSAPEFTPPPAGTHIAICYRVLDLGTQQTEYQGQTKHQHKVMISWELPDERMEDGKPFTVHQRYTFSSHEKAKLRQDLEAWRGAPFKDSDFGPGGFHLSKLLGVPCVITLVHETKGTSTYANIRSIGKMMKGQQVPPLTNSKLFFSLTPSEFSADMLESLPQKIKETIKKSPEYAELMKEPVGDAAEEGHVREPALNDDIPF
jgi:hypothetical protein